MTHHKFSGNHWLEPVLARELAPVEAPFGLAGTVYGNRRAKPALNIKFAWVAATLVMTLVGLTTHFYAQRTLPGTGAGLSRLQAAAKPIRLQGACHLCHSGEYL